MKNAGEQQFCAFPVPDDSGSPVPLLADCRQSRGSPKTTGGKSVREIAFLACSNLVSGTTGIIHKAWLLG